jgi:hypothetical protein
MKSRGNSTLLTHLPQLVDFIKPYLEKFFSSYAVCFYKKLKSDDLRSNPTAIPTSARFDFKLNLIDSVKQVESSTNLLAECNNFVENAQQELAKFARRAFEINRNALTIGNVKSLCRLLSCLAIGLIAKLNITGYNHHQAVIDLLALHTDKMLIVLKTTAYLFLKYYKEEFHLAELPSPSMPCNFEGALRALAPSPAPSPAQTVQPTAATGSAARSPPGFPPTPAPATHARRAAPQASAAPPPSTPRPHATPTTLVVHDSASAQGSALSAPPATALQNGQHLVDPTTGRLLEATSFRHANGQVMYCLVSPTATPGAPGETNQAIAEIQTATDWDVEMAPPEPIPYPQDTPAPAAPSVATPSPTFSPPRAGVPLPPTPPPFTPPAMSGGVSTLLRGLEQAFDLLIVQPVQDFHDTYVGNQERLRILKATTPAALDNAAEEIAEEVNAERSVTPKTLRGVVRAEANNVNHGLNSKLAALQEEINKLKGAKGRPAKKKTQKGNFRSSGQTAKQNPATKQTRGGTAGPGGATKDDSKKSNKGRSKNKSNGKKTAPSTKKRS